MKVLLSQSVFANVATIPADLETVVLQALRKNREERYQSAAALADDLRRVQTHQPVTARSPTATYYLQKLCRRHKGLVIGAAFAAGAVRRASQRRSSFRPCANCALKPWKSSAASTG